MPRLELEMADNKTAKVADDYVCPFTGSNAPLDITIARAVVALAEEMGGTVAPEILAQVAAADAEKEGK
jgi:hypothetical protein